ncbi:MAG: LysR family transcriptional regulator [Chloroflexi bacterium]|nr:LysR family transcriptional regulator [Chloroflexota bacterium]
MTLNQLLYFHAVAKTGSYSRAAEESDVSEPVVHRAIRRLEKTCGMKLLERVGNRVCLTKGGRAIYDYAAQIASLADLTAQSLVEERGLISGQISIGAGTPVGLYLLPDILAKWMAEHPRVNIAVTIAEGKEVHRLLLEDRLDLTFTSVSEPAPGLRRELIFADALVVVAPLGHPFAQADLLSLVELSQERTILPSRGSSIRSEIEQVEFQYGVQLKVVMEVNKQDSIKHFCKAGVGLAILPKSVVIDEVASGQLHLLNVEGFPRSRPYFLVYRAGKPLTPEIQSLLSAVRLWVEERHRGWQPLTVKPGLKPHDLSAPPD